MWCTVTSAQYMNWALLAQDTVYYANEYMAEGYQVTSSGPAQVWDFRSLKAPYAISRRITTSADRNGLLYASLLNGKQSASILLLSGKTSQVVQVLDDNPVCPGGKLTYTLTPSYKPFFNGVLGEQYTYRGKMSAVFAWPRNFSCMWSPPQLPDSCRVTYTIKEENTVDAEGTLYLPTEVHTAYRHQVEIQKAIRIEVKYGVYWQDVTALVPGVHLITTKHLFRFVSSISGLQLLEIEIKDNGTPYRLEFITHPLVTRVFVEEPVRPDIFAYPNPSYDVVRLQLSDLPFGQYKLKIFNILGVPVRETSIEVNDRRTTIALDLGDLPRGTYLYRLQDSVGRTIKTKRVVLIQS